MKHLWHKLWADFDDEFSLTLTRDRARLFLATTPMRLVFYLSVGALLAAGLLALCDGEVRAPPAHATPTPFSGW